MPTFKDVKISIVADDDVLPEYGITMRQSKTTHQASCFIPSIADTKFRICFTPTPGVYNEFKHHRPQQGESIEEEPRRSSLHDWDFSARIFFDGRRIADKRIVINVPRPGDRVIDMWANGTLVRTPQGDVEYSWCFKDIGLEHLLSSLSTEEKKGGDDTHGQIKIELHRVVLGNADQSGTPLFNDTVPTNISSDIDAQTHAHTLGYVSRKSVAPSFVAVTHFDTNADKDSIPWATFVFMYRSEKVLRRMGFIKDDLEMNDLMAGLGNVRMEEEECKEEKDATVNDDGAKLPPLSEEELSQNAKSKGSISWKIRSQPSKKRRDRDPNIEDEALMSIYRPKNGCIYKINEPGEAGVGMRKKRRNVIVLPYSSESDGEGASDQAGPSTVDKGKQPATLPHRVLSPIAPCRIKLHCKHTVKPAVDRNSPAKMASTSALDGYEFDFKASNIPLPPSPEHDTDML